jgi:signal transduction histidine kinase
MHVSTLYKRAVLILDCLLVLLSIYAASLVAVKPDVPFALESVAGELRLLQAYTNQDGVTWPAGTMIESFAGLEPTSLLSLEYAVDRHRIGESVEVSIAGRSHTITLVPYYAPTYLFCLGFSALCFYFFAIFLWVKRPEDPAARIAHWVSILIALIICFDWGKSLEHSVYMRLFYTLAYSFAPYVLTSFSLEYPVQINGWRRTVMNGMAAIALLLASWSSIGLLYLEQRTTLEEFGLYETATKFMEIFFALGALFAVANFIHSYRTAVEESTRRRIRWVLLGFAFSCTSYVLLWLGPKILGLGALVPEGLVLITVSVSPFTFAVSIVKYHLFDIDRIANRATVYVIVLITLGLLYATLVAIAASFIHVPMGNVMPNTVNVIAAVLVALAFEPVKRRVQHFVDRRFFKVRYDSRRLLAQYSSRFQDVYTKDELGEVLRSVCEDVLNVERWELTTANEEAILEPKAYGQDRLIESAAAYTSRNDLGLWAIKLPIMIEQQPQALLMLGPKRSGLRYSVEDIDLLNSISALAGIALSRIELTEDLAEEKMRAEKLRELSELKSVFVSSVTHDLKTPLTSIKLFTEMLETAYGPDDKTAREYLGIISGESDRLRTLIDNVLDHTKIERGVMTYNFRRTELNAFIGNVIRKIEYLIKMQGFELKLEIPDTLLFIDADPDLFESSVLNLLSNAMKYSAEEKHIAVKLQRDQDRAVLTITDRGVGIAKADLPHIFQAFYRVRSNGSVQAQGAGLGLSNVAHIVEAHRGSIDVDSVPGIGTKVTLSFPLLVTEGQLV